MDNRQSMSFSEQERAEARQLNRKLARFPRFKIRNRVMPVLIQSLLRVSQIGGGGKLTRHGLQAEKKIVSSNGVPVSVRIIRPKGQPKGVVLDFHGGGWVIGNAQMNDDLNVAMVNECEVAVVSVDYRLAVSTPVEGVMEDCFSAACWLLGDSCSEFAGLPVIVVGESAGGHLAATTLLKLKEKPELLQRIKGALLYYGVYDLTGTPSVRNAGPETLVLDGPGMVEALRLLTPGLTDEQRQQPALSPLYGDLSGMPPALMFVGDIDPLLDDTLQMAERWKTVAEVEMHRLPDLPHGFVHFPTAMSGRVLARSREWLSGMIKRET